MNTTDLLKHIAEALDVEEDSVSLESSSETLEEWDSLGHITILGTLDDVTSGASADLVDLTQATSVKELIEILSNNNLLDS
tara:strand:+ start:31 stop:273 length:243 start_codon:yes stop_codon:yes gene_type:complete